MTSDFYKLEPIENLVSIHDSERKPVKKSDRKTGSFPYYGASGITDYVDNFIFDGDYVLLSEDGDNLKTRNTPIAFMATRQFWVNNHAHILKGKNGNNTQFICYALQVADVTSFISGSTRPKITQRDMKKIPIYSPPLIEQKAIAHILGSLDKKIELNRQMNETLEAMAQALFKSWFVDFDPIIDNALAAGHTIPDVFAERAAQRKAMNKDEAINPLFPDAFEYTEEVGWIPEGWIAGNLMNLSTKITDGSHHSPPSVDKHLGSPMASSKDLTSNGVNFDLCRSISKEDFDTLISNGCSPIIGDVLISKDGSRCGETCCIYNAETDVVLLSSVAIIRPKKNEHSTYINTLLSRPETIADLRENYVSGSAIPRIVLRDFKRFPLIIPSDEVFKQWSSQVDSIYQKQKNSYLKSNTLAKLRDTLLPKLLSGELRIPDTEKLIEEATANKVDA